MIKVTRDDFTLLPEISHAILTLYPGKKLTHKDVADVIEKGIQNMMTMDEWLDLINEGKKRDPQPMLLLPPETAITLRALKEATGYDFYTIFYYGLFHIYKNWSKDTEAKMDVIYKQVKKEFDRFYKRNSKLV